MHDKGYLLQFHFHLFYILRETLRLNQDPTIVILNIIRLCGSLVKDTFQFQRDIPSMYQKFQYLNSCITFSQVYQTVRSYILLSVNFSVIIFQGTCGRINGCTQLGAKNGICGQNILFNSIAPITPYTLLYNRTGRILELDTINPTQLVILDQTR